VRRRFVFLVLGALVALLVIGTLAALALLDANAYKARFEAAASRALGMEVGIGERLGIDFFPFLRVTLEDVHVRNRGAEIASVKQARLAIELLPLLSRHIRVRNIELKSSTLSVERGSDGLFNIEQPDAAGATLPALDWPSVTLSDATLVYADKQTGDAVHATACAMVAHRIRYVGGKTSDLLKELAFTGELGCGQARVGDFAVSDLKLSAEAARLLRDLLDQRLAQGQTSIEHEEVYPELLARIPIGYERVDGMPWTEIDFPDDVRRAETEILPRIQAL